MPTYEYVCTDCGADLEAVQTFSEPSLTECPTCGGKLRKRFGAVGVVFKGSGFYRNDSRTDGRGGSGERKSDTGDGGAAKADKSADSGTSGTSAAKTETKSEPAAKSGDSKPKSDAGSSSSPKASSAA